MIFAIVIAFAYTWTLSLVILGVVPIVLIAGGLEVKALSGHTLRNKKALETAGKVCIKLMDMHGQISWAHGKYSEVIIATIIQLMAYRTLMLVQEIVSLLIMTIKLVVPMQDALYLHVDGKMKCIIFSHIVFMTCYV